MKHNLMILVLALSLAGCMGESAAASDETKVEPAASISLAGKNVRSAKQEEIVTDAYTAKTDTYEIHIPKLNRDSEEAAEFNALLMDNYSPAASCAEEMQVSSYSLLWKSRTYQNILSIDILLEDDTGIPYHKIYSYDLDKDCQIDAQDVLDQMGLDEYEVRREAMRAAAAASDAAMSFEPLYDMDSTSDYLAGRQTSIAQAFEQSADAMCFYPEMEKRLQMYLSIYQPGAGQRHDVLCPLDFAEEDQPLSADCAFLHVTYHPSLQQLQVLYEDNTMDPSAQFQSTSYRNLYGFAYDYPYDIQGCFGHYADARIVNTGEGNELDPILFLLTENGTVEYVDLFRGALYGHYFNQGPICGLTNVKSLQEGEGKYGMKTMYALTNDNRQIDLMEHLFPGGISPSLEHTWSFQNDNQAWTLTFDDNASCIAEYRNGSDVQRFEGMASRIGTNEHGVVYAVDYEEENLTSLYVINVLERMILIRELEGSQSVFGFEPQEEHDLYLVEAEG